MKALSEEKPEIPKKPKPASEASEPKTKDIGTNGAASDPSSNATLKRPLDDAVDSEGVSSKKRKLGDAESKQDGVVDVDDDGDDGTQKKVDSGAIVIDDD